MRERTGRIPALVIGVGLNALGVMRSLGREAIPFYNVNPQRGYVVSSRWHRPPPRGWGQLEDGEPLAPYLEQLPVERAVLLATSDDRVQEVADLEPSLRERFPSATAHPEVVRALLDKRSLAELLAERGLPHPRTIDVRGAGDFAQLEPLLHENAFLKPRDSLAFNRRYGVKAFRVTSPDDAIARLEQLHGHPVVLQEYIPGDASRHFFIDGFIDRHGLWKGAFARQRIRMYPHDFGNSSSMISIPLTEVAAAMHTLERLLGDLQYRGIFSAEFKLDPRDGVFKLLEVNCRSWWFNGFAADCGVDTTLMAYDDALGLDVEPVASYKEGAKLVYSFNDLRAAWRLFRRSELEVGKTLKFWAGASDALFRWDDPLPFFRYAWQQSVRLGRGKPAAHTIRA